MINTHKKKSSEHKIIVEFNRQTVSVGLTSPSPYCQSWPGSRTGLPLGVVTFNARLLSHLITKGRWHINKVPI